MLQTIRKGQTSDLVKAAQYMIDTAARGTADGNFSANFESAVKKWQAEHKLDADGIIGPKTWTALATAMPISGTRFSYVQDMHIHSQMAKLRNESSYIFRG